MELCVVGAGYVGLVAAACLADLGHLVRVVERDAARRAGLQQGKVPWFEPGLTELLTRGLARGRLQFHEHIAEAARGVGIAFVAVGTPSEADGRPDTRDVDEVVLALAEVLAPQAVLVLKSTVPVGTADRLRAALAPLRPDLDLVSNPEFLAEGSAVTDFTEPDRIVIGAARAAAGVRIERLYAPYAARGRPVLHMDNRSAELAKYAANAALAARVSLMNELAALAEGLGADIDAVRRVVGSDHRIGEAYLFAGAGFGGSCFPKDLAALSAVGARLGVPVPIVEAVRSVNEAQRGRLLHKVRSAVGALAGARVAVWGVAFKPGTDDVREAPAVALIDGLLAAGASVVAYDPKALPAVEARYGDRVQRAAGPLDAAEGADAVVLVTEWPELRGVDLSALAARLRRPHLVDGRNIFDPAEAARVGLQYVGFGRPLPPQDRP